MDFYENCPAVVTNLRKDLKVWSCLSRILGREETYARVLGTFYIAVVQATLLFGAVLWVKTPCMERNLGGFHHRVTRQIMVDIPKRQPDRGGTNLQ